MKFPVSVAEFAENQERLIGRPLFDNERKCLEIWTPVINDIYTDGLDAELLSMLDQFIAHADGRPALIKFLKAAKYWMQYADKCRRVPA